MTHKFGITSLWFSFLEDYLKDDPSLRRRIACLQLSGRLEDYLVKEFMQFIYWRSGKLRYCEGNLGKRRKVDIALIRHTRSSGLITAMIEAKYLPNRVRCLLAGNDDNQRDMIRKTLQDLASQLRFKPTDKHGDFAVDPRAKVYGLVFASYVHRKNEPNQPRRKKEFFQRVIKVARDERLRYHDLPTPRLDSIYENHRIVLFNETWQVSLRGALWRL